MKGAINIAAKHAMISNFFPCITSFSSVTQGSFFMPGPIKIRINKVLELFKPALKVVRAAPKMIAAI